jgi:nitrite reductase/ring-hydroxylating ferredoxin subunit
MEYGRLSLSRCANICSHKRSRESLEGGSEIAVILTAGSSTYGLQTDDGFYATADTCSHAGASLAASDIDLEECTVECPYHGSLFEIKTGRVLSMPVVKAVPTYRVKTINDEVFVETA